MVVNSKRSRTQEVGPQGQINCKIGHVGDHPAHSQKNGIIYTALANQVATQHDQVVTRRQLDTSRLRLR